MGDLEVLEIRVWIAVALRGVVALVSCSCLLLHAVVFACLDSFFSPFCFFFGSQARDIIWLNEISMVLLHESSTAQRSKARYLGTFFWASGHIGRVSSSSSLYALVCWKIGSVDHTVQTDVFRSSVTWITFESGKFEILFKYCDVFNRF